MDLLKVERIGGLAGFGGFGSKIKSRGEVSLASLSDEDQATVEHLFGATSSKPKPSALRDGFCYKISRTSSKGSVTIEVPEHAVPDSIARCVKDQLA
jgi:hypothetical protein